MVTWTGGSEGPARLFSSAADRHVEVANDTRLRIDRDIMRMFAKRPLLGWGMGTFEDVYPQFRSFYTNFLIDKAHNDYLQLLGRSWNSGIRLCYLVFGCISANSVAQYSQMDVRHQRVGRGSRGARHQRDPGP